MDIILITPALPGSKAGNRATAERWAELLYAAGHRVSIRSDYHAEPADLMIALHAWRSHQAITAFRLRYPTRPLIVVLTGTDLYQFQFSHPEATHQAMATADVLVGLHRLVGDHLSEANRAKLMTVLQSASEPLPRQTPSPDCFEVCVIGHLRAEKDSLRAALAARRLPETSGIRIVQAGRAYDSNWEAQAETEQAINPRFSWLGEVDRATIQQLMARSQVMVISSLMEGGANVVCEACRAGLPVIASDIPGNRGLLGDSYPGYFPVGDDKTLATLLARAEDEPAFLATLRNQVQQRADDFLPAAEQAALLQVINQAFSVTGSIASP